MFCGNRGAGGKPFRDGEYETHKFVHIISTVVDKIGEA
jgi:hypothetical protein